MSITEFFKKVGAPLKNSRWSWGAIREDGSVVLRVWQERKKRINEKWYMLIINYDKYKDNKSHPGYKERVEQIDLIKKGAECYMVMCLAKNKDTFPREIQSYNRDDLFVGGELYEDNNGVYIELKGRTSARKIT